MHDATLLCPRLRLSRCSIPGFGVLAMHRCGCVGSSSELVTHTSHQGLATMPLVLSVAKRLCTHVSIVVS